MKKGATGVIIRFVLKDEITASMNEQALQDHLGHLVEKYKKVPGLLEKTFFVDADNLDQGAFLIFESKADWDTYTPTALYKNAVLDICEGEPSIEIYSLTASLKDGVIS